MTAGTCERAPGIAALAIAVFASSCSVRGEECALPDSGVELVDARACRNRVVIGPVIITAGVSVFAGDGVPVSRFPSREHRVRLFRDDGSVAIDRTVVSRIGSDYFDLGAISPGTYRVAVEVLGTSLVVGAELVRSDPCPGALAGGPACRAPRFDVLECEVVFVPVGLGCQDETGTTCGFAP